VAEEIQKTPDLLPVMGAATTPGLCQFVVKKA